MKDHEDKIRSDNKVIRIESYYDDFYNVWILEKVSIVYDNIPGYETLLLFRKEFKKYYLMERYIMKFLKDQKIADYDPGKKIVKF